MKSLGNYKYELFLLTIILFFISWKFVDLLWFLLLHLLYEQTFTLNAVFIKLLSTGNRIMWL